MIFYVQSLYVRHQKSVAQQRIISHNANIPSNWSCYSYYAGKFKVARCLGVNFRDSFRAKTPKHLAREQRSVREHSPLLHEAWTDFDPKSTRLTYSARKLNINHSRVKFAPKLKCFTYWFCISWIVKALLPTPPATKYKITEIKSAIVQGESQVYKPKNYHHFCPVKDKFIPPTTTSLYSVMFAFHGFPVEFTISFSLAKII